MDKLTLATLGLGVLLAWVALSVCALVLRVPLAKGQPHTLPSPWFRYRTLVFALLGAASMSVLPSLREGSEGLLGQKWQAATKWVQPLTFEAAWPESILGRALSVFAVLWCLLVAVSLVRALFAHLRVVRVCRRAIAAPAFVQARALIVARRLGMRLPELLVSDETEAPFATGFLSPRIVLPSAGLGGFSTEQLDFVLHHELVHVERGDLRVALWVGIARLVFTGHPLQRAFLAEISWAREASVDARVAANRPLQYAAFLLELAEGMSMGRMNGTLPMADSTLSKRIALLLSRAAATPTRMQRRAPALLALAGVGLAALVWLTPVACASPPASAAETTHHCELAGGPK